MAAGYARALKRVPGVEAREWYLWPRLQFWHVGSRAWGRELRANARHQGATTKRTDFVLDKWGVTLKASLDAVEEALRFNADWVVIICGIGFHPDAVVFLRRAGRRVAAIFTENPYADKNAAQFASVCDRVFVNDRTSLRAVPGSIYLPTAYDQEIHRPGVAEPLEPCDVRFIGTGFKERVRLLSRVNWDGVDLRIRGFWPAARNTSIWPNVGGGEFRLTPNEEARGYYAGAKINLNLYRHDGPPAESMNPRAYELAAMRLFSLHEDARPETREVFGNSVGYFDSGSPISLQAQVVHYLQSDSLRERMAELSWEKVQGHHYDARTASLLAGIDSPVRLAVV